MMKFTALVVLCLSVVLNGQTCGSGDKVVDSSCCNCEPGFAPPDCKKCIAGYLLGIDPTTGKDKCYNGVTDCHNLLPAPWGCGGKGKCVACAPGVDPCYPKCECNPGVTGDKCEGQATSQCLPESVHMYTVYPQEPVSDELFNVMLWGCSIDGSSQYQVLPEDAPCGTTVDPLCTVKAGDMLEIRHEDAASPAAVECNTCGECSSSVAWELVASDSSCSNGTTATTLTAASLADCMAQCETSATCSSVNYVCKTGVCMLYAAACAPVASTTGSAMWKIKALPTAVATDASKGCTVCNTNAAGSSECLQTYNTYWRPISVVAACDGKGGALLSTERDTKDLNACFELCESTSECLSVDWFCQTKSCMLYAAPCGAPGTVHHGSSSYELMPTQATGSLECSQCGECPAQLKPGQSATAISVTAACDGNDEGVGSYKEPKVASLSECITACSADAECKAVDWFCQVRTCKLYKKACNTPKATFHGASSFTVSGSTTSRSGVALAGVTDAVTPGVTCHSKSKATGNCFDTLKTFDEAKNTCASEGPGWRLCYIAELQSGVCCSTGCNQNTKVVWTLDTYGGSTGRSCPAMGQSHKGCPTTEQKGKPSCGAVSHTKAVACCDKTAAMCYTSKSVGGKDECFEKYATLQEATKICTDDGKRLCTMQELDNGLCCGRGCNIGSSEVWTSQDAQQACTSDELQGKFANPAGMYDGCQQTNAANGVKEHPEQCREAKNAAGSVRCCYEPQAGDPTPEPTPAPNSCTGTTGQVEGSIVKNSQKGCFVISSRKDDSYWTMQGGKVLAGSKQGAGTVRFVTPFTKGTESCSVLPKYTVQSHPNYAIDTEPCSARTGATPCPTCTASVESCDQPGLFLKLDEGKVSFEAAPFDACNAYNETACTLSACRWQNKKCATIALEKFAEVATFKIFLHQDYTNYTGFESLGGQNIVPDGGNVVGRDSVAAGPDGKAWMMTEIPGAKTSSEAVLPGIMVKSVPAGGAKYKICQKKNGAWSALQTHDQDGYRTWTFQVLDLATALRGAPSGGGEEDCCNGIELFDICIPWWVFLLLWILLMACAGGMKMRQNKQETDAVKNNKKYDEFELDEKVEETGKGTAGDDDDDV
eukprot:TRINITY_DN2253_c2_g1_i1.p1 TRINITY_DN2253_c2_g1~~TRINITY_DN2253_c2_g1_i1.p1  ORF type:complete len:1110 (+),score=313.86 TRINITY_DN2253_c2_g1_i1:84-3413(+)